MFFQKFCVRCTVFVFRPIPRKIFGFPLFNSSKMWYHIRRIGAVFPGEIRAIVAQLDRAFGSDPEGQRFESSRSHQEQHLMGCCSFCFARILWGSKREDSNSPCPAAWRIPSGTPKSALQYTFAMRFFYSDFRIILVAYHLRHQCIALLPVDHFSVDLQWYT